MRFSEHHKQIVEAFDGVGYETTLVKKGGADLRYHFTTEDGTEYQFRVRTASKYGALVKRVTLRQKQGSTFKDAFKRIDNVGRVMTTFFDLVAGMRKEPLLKETEGVILDFSTKAAPRAKKLIQRIYNSPSARRVQRKWELLSSDQLVNEGDIILIRLGYTAKEVFDGPKGDELVKGKEADLSGLDLDLTPPQPEPEKDVAVDHDRKWNIVVNKVVARLGMDIASMSPNLHAYYLVGWRNGELELYNVRKYEDHGNYFKFVYMGEPLIMQIWEHMETNELMGYDPDEITKKLVRALVDRVDDFKNSVDKSLEREGPKAVSDGGDQLVVNPKRGFKKRFDAMNRKDAQSTVFTINRDGLAGMVNFDQMEYLTDMVAAGGDLEAGFDQFLKENPSLAGRKFATIRATILRDLAGSPDLKTIVNADYKEIFSDMGMDHYDQAEEMVSGADRPYDLAGPLSRLLANFDDSIYTYAIEFDADRAYALPEYINLRKNSSPTVLYHEYGHIIEYARQSILKRSLELLKNNVGDKNHPETGYVKIIYPGTNEIGVYTDAYTDDYTAKIYNEIHGAHIIVSKGDDAKFLKKAVSQCVASEVLSMGLQQLVDPVTARRFAAASPVHYQHTVDMLKRITKRG